MFSCTVNVIWIYDHIEIISIQASGWLHRMRFARSIIVKYSNLECPHVFFYQNPLIVVDMLSILM